jgi:hypothetical protein
MKNLFLLTTMLIIAYASIHKLKANSVNDKDKDDNCLVYQSTANGVAEILLTLKPNRKFTFYMRIIPQPMTEEKESIVKASGKWSKRGNWMRLVFRGKKVILNALFDKNYANNNEFKIIDERTVDLNTQLDVLTIWGVPCIKIKK